MRMSKPLKICFGHHLGLGNYSRNISCLFLLSILFTSVFFNMYPAYCYSWDIVYVWDTGDVNSRVTWFCQIIDKAHDGTPYIIAPILHGVKCFDRDGNLQWTYAGITNGYDVRDLAVGDLAATGFNDCVVIASGYTAYVGKVGIVDKDGNEIDELINTDFSGSASLMYRVVLDGTDIYLGSNVGLHKFIKNGGTWSESWYKGIGEVRDMVITDAGNGKRIFVSSRTGANSPICYQTDGTQDWAVASPGGYDGRIAIGNTDSSKTGKEVVMAGQNYVVVYDKDGSLSATITTGTNVRTGLTLYDCDADGEDEIYYSDMGRDMFCIERTGVNTYSTKYTLLDYLTNNYYAGLEHCDINNDGNVEIIASSTNGRVYIYDKTITTQLKVLYVSHDQIGTYDSPALCVRTGIQFVDTSGDTYIDMVIPDGTGYVQVFEWTEFSYGYSEGYDAGYDVGWTEGNSTGYTAGYDDGWIVGNSTGYIAGWVEGNSTGYANGYSAGWLVGNATGYGEGYSIGYSEGYSIGYGVGYADGYSDGYNPYIVSAFNYEPCFPSNNTIVTFDGTYSGSSSVITNWSWNFGDENTTSGNYPTITHKYVSDSCYNSTLTITSSEGSSAIEICVPIGTAGRTGGVIHINTWIVPAFLIVVALLAYLMVSKGRWR